MQPAWAGDAVFDQDADARKKRGLLGEDARASGHAVFPK